MPASPGAGSPQSDIQAREPFMHLIRPFTGLRPVPAHTAAVVAPPYDVLSTEEARERAAGRPWSFLHISKPEIDLPAGADPYAAEVYAKAAENLDRMLAAGILARASSRAPDADVTADAGIRHALWVVRDAEVIARLTRAFDALPALYIADGHHRSAAASRVAAARRAANPRHTGTESYNYFLSVIFPHHQMKIMDYNRVVRDINGLGAEAFLGLVAENFGVEPSAAPVRPAQAGEVGMYLGGHWYRLRIRPQLIPQDDPVGRLDVSLLADHLLAPLLGILDPRRDRRIDFVGGIRGLGELERRVDSGEMTVAFALFPTRMEELMAVADAGEVMPPKSTWFEPKLADGLVSHVLD